MGKLYNLARMSTATTGTGTITLGSAVSGYLSFAGAGAVDGDVVSYGIKDGTNSEVGYGTYTATGTTLTRNVTKSTNSNAAISLSGSAEVFITPRAEELSGDYVATSYGIVADGHYLSDGTITTGTNAFSSASASFTASDVGKTIVIQGAGAAGVTLKTTISGFTNSTHVTLTANAGTSVTTGKTYYGTDNTTAINSLITTVSTANDGGAILFPPGMYLFGSAISFPNVHNITLTGQSRNLRVLPPGVGSALVFVGTGTGNAISVASAKSITLENLGFIHANDQFTGNFVNIANDGTNGDAAYNMVRGCTFDPGVLVGPAAWIKLDKAIINQVRDCTFWGGTYAISMATVTGSYVNVITIDGCMFGQYASRAIYGCAQSLNVTNNTFEQRSDGGTVAWDSPSSSFTTLGSFWAGNWFGDATVGTSCINVYGSGFTFTGNFISGPSAGTAIALNGVNGFSITGNQFYTWANGINYASASNGGIVQGNNFHSVTTMEANTTNKGAAVSTANNSTV